ncbi:hypothetical protein OKW21_005798 [Catalinimonas alkaloidigena]|uniref:hypothetical protein n=1 Tax=Catalinimonas alkaloidigena TaxID=1075417 RepID=UPI002406AC98|nr:hypothetical protein [Catalinimonas alkaloidigena]MDF9800535.1 hypothetical protein [Catalinimonas alkaloidigena]
MKKVLFTLVGLCFLSSTMLWAQELKPQGYFDRDTLKVGEPLIYTLTFRYPKNLEVVFPGEADQYAPFEYLDRTFAPTYSDSVYSYDSVAYQLTTFEIDSIQSLALPVYVINTNQEGEADSTTIYASIDSIYLDRLIKQMPDSLALKQNTSFRDVALQFNYPYLLVALATLLLIAVLVYVIFGKQIRRQWKLYQLKKNQKKFQEQFAKALEALRKSPNKRRSESTLLVWKQYMERLDQMPYTKLTTKEIVNSPAGEPLQQDLKAIDRSIYGRHANGELIRYFEHLEQHTNHRFKQKIEEIKNAD